MINPGLGRYEVVLDNQYYLRELIESMTLEESLDEISMRATMNMVIPENWPGIDPGQDIYVSGIPFGGQSMTYLLHPGVVWECQNSNKGIEKLSVTIYDRTIYLAKSEDEYLMPTGQTSSQRIKQYVNDWGIPIANIPDTGIALEKGVYRSQSIYAMMVADLKETAQKGGKMYRPRMTPDGLELYELGTNATVWVLELGQNIEDITQKRTLEGATTQVKILGSRKQDSAIDTSGMTLEEIGRLGVGADDTKDLPSPVLAIEKGETDQFGTLQKILQNEKIKTVEEARKAAQQMLSGIQETITVSGIDINTIRAGDKVELAGSNMELLVISAHHNLGQPGHMTLELATTDYVRRRYYYGRSV